MNIGIDVLEEVEKEMKKRISKIIGLKHNVFPGSQPVSFTEKSLTKLKNQDYYVCEKSDGVRQLLYITIQNNKQKIFTINREYKFKEHRGEGLRTRKGELHENILLDCEFVTDILDEEKQVVCIVFDILFFKGVSVCHLSFGERIKIFLNEFINPYKEIKNNNFPFYFDSKEIQASYHAKHILKKVVPFLKHNNDGLIFTPVKQGYMTGTCVDLIKWKPPYMNTVDFKITIEWIERKPKYILNIADGLFHRKQDVLNVDDSLLKEWEQNQPDGKIAECLLVNGKWIFQRFREDKKTANNKEVFQKIILSIEENITEEKLFLLSDEIKKKWKERELNRIF